MMVQKNKELVLELTRVEAGYLHTIALEHRNEGCYYGRKDHFYSRQDKVIDKIRKALGVGETT